MDFECDALIAAKGFAMTLRNGRELLSIPGPTTVPDEVLNAMHRQAMEIYSGPIVEITMSCLDDLRRMFRTKGRTYIYTANGHGAWEAAAANVLSRGEKVLVMESGRFAAGWGEMAGMMFVEIETLPACWRNAVDPASLEAAFSQCRVVLSCVGPFITYGKPVVDACIAVACDAMLQLARA